MEFLGFLISLGLMLFCLVIAGYAFLAVVFILTALVGFLITLGCAFMRAFD